MEFSSFPFHDKIVLHIQFLESTYHEVSIRKAIKVFLSNSISDKKKSLSRAVSSILKVKIKKKNEIKFNEIKFSL